MGGVLGPVAGKNGVASKGWQHSSSHGCTPDVLSLFFTSLPLPRARELCVSKENEWSLCFVDCRVTDCTLLRFNGWAEAGQAAAQLTLVECTDAVHLRLRGRCAQPCMGLRKRKKSSGKGREKMGKWKNEKLN